MDINNHKVSSVQYREAGKVFTNVGQIIFGSTLANCIFGNSSVIILLCGVVLTIILILIGLCFWKKSSIEEFLSDSQVHGQD